MTRLLSHITQHIALIQYAVLALLLIYIIGKGVIPGWNTIITDFPNYYISAKVIVDGEDVERLYDDEWFQKKISQSGIDALGKFSPQPPVAALTFTPLAYFSPIAAKRIWLIMSLLFLGGIIVLIQKLFSFSLLSSSVIILLMGRALSNDIFYGQLYLLISFLMLLALWLIRDRDAQALAGVILAITAVLKYFPVVIIFYACVIKKYRVVMASLVTLLALGIVQILIFGWEVMRFYVVDILPAHLAGNIPGQGAFAFAYQSWPSFLSNVFVYNSAVNPDPIFNWAIGKTIGIVLIYITLILALFYYLRQIKQSNLSKFAKKDWSIIILIITGLALLPATASYHFLFLIIPFCLLLKLEDARWKMIIIALVVAINFFPYPFTSNENIIMLILSYPRLMAVSLLLIIIYFKLSQQLKLEV